MYKQWNFKDRRGRLHILDITFYPQSWGIGLAIWPRNIVLDILCFEIDYYWGRTSEKE